jgi:hypothetical protein
MHDHAPLPDSLARCAAMTPRLDRPAAPVPDGLASALAGRYRVERELGAGRMAGVTGPRTSSTAGRSR